MGRVSANNFGLSAARESAFGTIPATGWKALEPNSISSFGADITTVARAPISASRQRRKGTVTDLESSVEFEHDLNVDTLDEFIEGFIFARKTNRDIDITATAATATAYTVPSFDDTYDVDRTLAAVDVDAAELARRALADASAAKVGVGTLIYARGSSIAGNNGLKAVSASLAANGTALTLGASSLTAETANITLALAGYRFAASPAVAVTDATANSPQTVTLTTTSNFGALGLSEGQYVHVGSPDSSGSVQNALLSDIVANGGTPASGYARVRALTDTSIVLDRLDNELQVGTLTAGGSAVDLLFGNFIRNVQAGTADYAEISYAFEGAYPGLASDGEGTLYQYALGNFCNSLAINLPLTDKATVTLGFVGSDTDSPGAQVRTGSAESPTRSGAFNTSSDIGRLLVSGVDDIGLTTDFKSLTLTLNNNVTPEKVLGQLGARYVNTGIFEVSVEAQLVFTNALVISTIRENTEVGFATVLKNDDVGSVVFDIPAMTLGGGDREFPTNESVLINTTGEALGDADLNTSIGVSLFPITPDIT